MQTTLLHDCIMGRKKIKNKNRTNYEILTTNGTRLKGVEVTKTEV